MARYLIENKASVNGSQRDTMDDRAKSVFEDIMGSIGFGYGK
jgi:hypothetical protein